MPPARAAELIERIVAGNTGTALGACGDLLARCAAGARDADRAVDFLPAAKALVEALPGDPARASQPDWRRPPVDSRFIVDLLTALSQLDAALADRAVDHLLAWPKTYGLDSVLVPAALALTERAASRDRGGGSPPARRLPAHLRARIAEPLEPPRDWTRASALPCPCPHCSELSRFLADPDRKAWAFKAVEAKRSHVEDSIRRSGCDLDFTTDTRGRPYSLICTKNQASYETAPASARKISRMWRGWRRLKIAARVAIRSSNSHFQSKRWRTGGCRAWRHGARNSRAARGAMRPTMPT